MKLKKKFLLNISLALLISTIVFLFSSRGISERVETAGIDLLFRLRGFSSFNPSVVVIEITDEDIEDVGRWPWSREWHAAVTKALKDFGARQIYFDIIFSEPSNIEEEDLAFAQAMEYAGNVYLPFAFRESHTSRETALYPTDILASNIRGSGSINVYPDIDGTIRKMPIFFREKGRVHPHIALKIAMDHANKEIRGIEKNRLILSSPAAETVIPLGAGNNIPINWLGKWEETFIHYSYLDILLAYKAIQEGVPPQIDLRPIKDSICLVAVTAIGLYDIRPTPIEAEYPGVGAIATVISTILDDKLMTPAPMALNVVLIYVLGLVPFLFVSGEKSMREILSVALLMVFFFFAVTTLFRYNYQINYVPPMLSLIASYSAVATFHFVRVSVERQKFFHLAVTDGLTGLANIRYFMMILNAEFSLAKRQPDDRKFCVVMIDIDHFKEFNDTYGHAVGDLVLRETGDTIKASVRSSDLVARYGGEEMVVMLRAAGIKDAMTVAEKIRKNVEDHEVKGGGKDHRVRISLGVAGFSPDDPDSEKIIKRADDALYKAKGRGRNRVETLEEQGREGGVRSEDNIL